MLRVINKLKQRIFKFGGYSISRELFDRILSINPYTILELGCGYGTLKLLDHFNVISIEHDIEWSEKIKKLSGKRKGNHFLFNVPIMNRWYNYATLDNIINYYKKSINLVIIDGPPGELRANIRAAVFETLIEKNCIFIFDDVNRHIDMLAARYFCDYHGYSMCVYGSEKQFAVCSPTNK